MPNKVVRRSKIAEGLSLLAVLIALSTSSAGYFINDRSIERVNESRKAVYLQACEDTNQRFEHTVALINKAIDKGLKRAKTPQQRDAIKQQKVQTIILINALVPHRNCTTYVFKLLNRASL